MKILITGAGGFIAGYLIPELISRGHDVVGIDDCSEYGLVRRSFEDNPNYTFYQGDVRNKSQFEWMISDCDMLIAAATRYFGKRDSRDFSYDVLADNGRIIASTLDAAIHAYREYSLKKIILVSSSQIYGSDFVFPTIEGEERKGPPPKTTYGLQRLAAEFFIQGAYQQYQLPYTIVRPFTCIGAGERVGHEKEKSAGKIVPTAGNIKIARNSIVSNLVLRILKGEKPIRIVGNAEKNRYYTYGGDAAQAIAECVDNDTTTGQEINISAVKPVTLLKIAQLAWEKIHGTELRDYKVADIFRDDKSKRTPGVDKAKSLMNFEATTSIETILDEIISWMKREDIRRNS